MLSPKPTHRSSSYLQSHKARCLCWSTEPVYAGGHEEALHHSKHAEQSKHGTNKSDVPSLLLSEPQLRPQTPAPSSLNQGFHEAFYVYTYRVMCVCIYDGIQPRPAGQEATSAVIPYVCINVYMLNDAIS